MKSLDISRWRWSWLGDVGVAESLGDGRYILKCDARQVINDEPSLCVEDPDLGIITDAEGNRFEITDWQDDHFFYVEVEKTDDGIEVIGAALFTDLGGRR